MQNIRNLGILAVGMRCFLGAAVMMSLVGTAGSAFADTAKDIKALKKADKSIKAKLQVIEAGLKSSGIQGADGPQGERGEQGIPGPRGADGARGANGTNGTNGTNGAVGAKGDKGDQGIPGTPGAPGLPGATGATGETGPAGPGADLGPITARVATVETTVATHEDRIDAMDGVPRIFNLNPVGDNRDCVALNVAPQGCFTPSGCEVSWLWQPQTNLPFPDQTLWVTAGKVVISAFNEPIVGQERFHFGRIGTGYQTVGGTVGLSYSLSYQTAGRRGRHNVIDQAGLTIMNGFWGGCSSKPIDETNGNHFNDIAFSPREGTGTVLVFLNEDNQRVQVKIRRLPAL